MIATVKSVKELSKNSMRILNKNNYCSGGHERSVPPIYLKQLNLSTKRGGIAMKVISVEQFLSIDKKVQNEIMKWWDPQMMDLYVPLDGEPTVICRQRQLEAVRRLKNEVNIPLLTVGQLIDFIEWKTGDTYLDRIYFICDGYAVEPCNEYCQDSKWVEKEMSFHHEDLLMALWLCVQGICE